MARKNISFNRILLKISGEVLAGEKTFGIDPNLTQTIAARIKKSIPKIKKLVLLLEEEIFLEEWQYQNKVWIEWQRII